MGTTETSLRKPSFPGTRKGADQCQGSHVLALPGSQECTQLATMGKGPASWACGSHLFGSYRDKEQDGK